MCCLCVCAVSEPGKGPEWVGAVVTEVGFRAPSWPRWKQVPYQVKLEEREGACETGSRPEATARPQKLNKPTFCFLPLLISHHQVNLNSGGSGMSLFITADTDKCIRADSLKDLAQLREKVIELGEPNPPPLPGAIYE